MEVIMKRNIKRIISSLLVTLLVLAAIPFSVSAEELTYVSVKQARAAEANAEVATSGTVIFIDGKNVVINDGEAGINLYLKSAASDLKVGDTVKAKGVRATYNGLQQLKNAELTEVVSASAAITYKETTIKAILDDASSEALESMPVLLKDVKIGAINTSGNTTLTAASGETINIYKCPALSGIAEGDTVTVKAVVSDFYDYQLRVSDAANVVKTASAEEPPAETVYVSVKEALAAETNSLVGTSGTIIFIDGKNVVINDGTAGINLYLNAANSELKVGDFVKATGSRAAYNGLQQLKGAEIVEIKAGTPVAAKETTIKALLGDYDTGALESSVVIIKDVKIGAINTSGNTPVTDAEGNTINIYKCPEFSGIAEGDTVTVTAVVGDFKGYQLRIVSASDIVKKAEEVTTPEVTTPEVTTPEVTTPEEVTTAPTQGETPETGDGTTVIIIAAVIVCGVAAVAVLKNKERV